MRNLLTVVIGLFLTFNCSNTHTKDNKGQNITQEDSSEQFDLLETNFIPDTIIGKISLINSQNVDSYLGNDVMSTLNDDGLPNSSVISKDMKQRLTFYFHPGSKIKEFSEFHVSYNDGAKKNDITAEDAEFISESGIKLGMSLDDFLIIKGEPDKLEKNKTTIYYYKIDEFENSDFLKRYNMPIYYAEYEFEQDYLIAFKFGFEYP